MTWQGIEPETSSREVGALPQHQWGSSRIELKTMWQNEKFLLLSQCSIKLSAVTEATERVCMWDRVEHALYILNSRPPNSLILFDRKRRRYKKRINPFPHTTILQQTTLNVFCQNIENLHNWMDNVWQKVENIVAKGEIACFVQFFLLSLCFQKAVCCRGVRKRLYERKG